MLDELDILFSSDTIKPTFDYVHIIIALYIFGENEHGLGRYRLQKELLIGSGTARSLITKLKEKSNFLTVIGETNRKGHILTKKGIAFLNRLKERMPVLNEGDLEKLKDIIIDSKGTYAYFCLVKNKASKISDGVEQRDAAIKVKGIGTTCLVFNGRDFIFPEKSIMEKDKTQMKVSDLTQKYFLELIEPLNKIEKNDVILIGLGKEPEIARLSAVNAALTII